MNSESVVIRQATPADADAIAAGNRRMAWETEDLSLDAATLAAGVRAALADPHKGIYWVAESDGSVVGQLMITYEWSDWRNGVFWWIQSVYVPPEHRRRGIFRKLYETVEAAAQQTPGTCGLRLYVERANEVAQAVYQSHGMERTPYQLWEKVWARHDTEPTT
jgi:ribosomal protein S18 acetylase RimI-like enzyme